MNSGSTDEELMLAYQNGNGDAFTILYSRHSSRVYGYLLKRLKTKPQADDVFQNTFLKLHNTRFSYDPSLPFAPWLFTICRGVLIDHVRKQQRSQEVPLTEEVENVPSEASKAEPEIPSLEGLNSQQREVIDLRFHGDLSFEEIAKRIETSPANVRQVLSRAIRKLRGASKVRTSK